MSSIASKARETGRSYSRYVLDFNRYLRLIIFYRSKGGVNGNIG